MIYEKHFNVLQYKESKLYSRLWRSGRRAGKKKLCCHFRRYDCGRMFQIQYSWLRCFAFARSLVRAFLPSNAAAAPVWRSFTIPVWEWPLKPKTRHFEFQHKKH